MKEKKEDEEQSKSIQSFVSGICLIIGIMIIMASIYFTAEMVNRQIKLNQQNAIVIDNVQYDLQRHKDKSEEQQLSFELIGRLSGIFIGVLTVTTALQYSNIFRESTEQ